MLCVCVCVCLCVCVSVCLCVCVCTCVRVCLSNHFLSGDGAGVGKGRTIAGLLVENETGAFSDL